MIKINKALVFVSFILLFQVQNVFASETKTTSTGVGFYEQKNFFGVLPQTGESGMSSLLFLGTALLVFSILILRRKKK